MIADGNGAIKTMRALNDSIQDETVSGQIDRLEEVSGRIFAYVNLDIWRMRCFSTIPR